MKKANAAAATAFLVVFAFSLIGLMYAHRNDTISSRPIIRHHLSLAPVREWGFYSAYVETLVACSPNWPDCNQIMDRRQYGPLADDREHFRAAPPRASRP